MEEYIFSNPANILNHINEINQNTLLQFSFSFIELISNFKNIKMLPQNPTKANSFDSHCLQKGNDHKDFLLNTFILYYNNFDLNIFREQREENCKVPQRNIWPAFRTHCSLIRPWWLDHKIELTDLPTSTANTRNGIPKRTTHGVSRERNKHESSRPISSKVTLSTPTETLTEIRRQYCRKEI